jgi:Tol biopolymer transport system component
MAVCFVGLAACFNGTYSAAAAPAICKEQVYPPATGESGAASFQSPACLPKRRLAFTVWHGGYNGWDKDGVTQSRSADIYVMNPADARKKVTVLGPKGVDKVNNIGHPAAGDYIVYNCNWSELCISNMRIGGQFRMYPRPADKIGGRFQEPVFDPTAKHIVFEWTKQEDEQTEQGVADICTMNRDGSNVTCAGYDGYNKQPSWSPRGDRIVFQRQCDEKECWQLWLAKVMPDGTIDKSSAVQFTKEFRSNTDASWSPDGSKIVYSCGGGAKAEICVSNANDVGNTVVLSDLGAPYNGAISWCSDGYIYFEAGQETQPQQPSVICRIPAPRNRR